MRRGALQDVYVCVDDNDAVEENAALLEATVLTVTVQLVPIEGEVDEASDAKSIEDALDLCPCQNADGVVLVDETDAVVLWLAQETLFGVLFVHHAEPHDRERGEDNVVALVDDLLVQCLSTEGGSETEPELRQHEQDVLVEHECGEDCVAPVSLPAVVEKQRLHESELRDCIVGRPRRLHPL